MSPGTTRTLLWKRAAYDAQIVREASSTNTSHCTIVRQDVQKEEPTSFTTDRLLRVRRLRPRGEGFVQDRYDDQAVQCCYPDWVVSRFFQAGADDCLVSPS